MMGTLDLKRKKLIPFARITPFIASVIDSLAAF
jgi:hypothetical protein